MAKKKEDIVKAPFVDKIISENDEYIIIERTYNEEIFSIDALGNVKKIPIGTKVKITKRRKKDGN